LYVNFFLFTDYIIILFLNKLVIFISYFLAFEITYWHSFTDINTVISQFRHDIIDKAISEKKVALLTEDIRLYKNGLSLHYHVILLKFFKLYNKILTHT